MARSNPKAHYHHDKLSSSSSSSSPLSVPAPAPAPALPPDSSLTIDFLMDSGGLSYDQAIQVIQKMPTLLRKGGKKPRLVIAYFESLGFSKTTHISKLISKSPRVLVSDVEKTLKPKIQVFIDFGFSKSDIAELTSSNPTLLRTGVKTQMKPALDLIKRFVNSDEDLIKIIKRNGYLLISNIRRKSIEPNVDVLRHHGVPDSEILHLIFTRLNTLMSTPKVFKSVVERIVSLGFKPKTRKFSTAVAAMCGLKKDSWDSKTDLLKGLGWSDEQILDTFRRNPRYLTLSVENMKESIEFFKESLNWDASILSHSSSILNSSLKRKVIPRYAVFKCLMSKEIIKQGTLMFISMLKSTETGFLSKYVFKYQDQLPHLYELYNKECMLGCEQDNGNRDYQSTRQWGH